MKDSNASRHRARESWLEWRHLPGICWFLTPWLLTGSLAAQSAPDVFPSQVIVLADWGMSDVSEIGYLHVGVIHERGGDRLAVYDVRRRTPVVQRPSEPQHRTPPRDGGVFLLGHFDRGNTNRLGGHIWHKLYHQE